MNPPRNPPRFAVDSNFLMALVEVPDAARDALDIIRQRVPEACVLATESVLNEIDNFIVTPSLGKRVRALKAQAALSARGIQLAPLADWQAAISEVIADKLLDQGLVPWEEKHDAHILAEASVLGCQMLVTSDPHLLDIDRARLSQVLQACGAPMVAVRSPRDIARQFAGRR